MLRDVAVAAAAAHATPDASNLQALVAPFVGPFSAQSQSLAQVEKAGEEAG